MHRSEYPLLFGASLLYLTFPTLTPHIFTHSHWGLFRLVFERLSVQDEDGIVVGVSNWNELQHCPVDSTVAE